MLSSVLKRAPKNLSAACSTLAQASIESHEYADRRRKLAAHVRRGIRAENKGQPVVIVANAAKQHFAGPDVPYPYRQCSYFRYLTGVTQPNSTLTIIQREDQEPVSILYVTKRTPREEIWEGPALGLTTLLEISGVDEIREMSFLHEDLERIQPAIASFDVDKCPNNDTSFEILSQHGPIVPLREHIDALRLIKSPAEQRIMRKTCEIGGQAMNAMIAKSRGIKNESIVVGRLEIEMRTRGAAYSAYPPVIAGASRANIIHYLDADQDLIPNDTVLVDAGCDYQGYASDITRVFPVGGHFTGPQKALYDALHHVHKELLKFADSVRPLTLNELYVAMLNELSTNLLELGLFHSGLTSQELILEADKLCPHHVSHYLGMDVHDTASVPRNIPIIPGVVFTIEPGVYVRLDNKAVKKEFRGLGMRIEDDILVTEDGCEVLTANCLRESDEIETLMKP